jgi:hypothetical protein
MSLDLEKVVDGWHGAFLSRVCIVTSYQVYQVEGQSEAKIEKKRFPNIDLVLDAFSTYYHHTQKGPQHSSR